MRALLRDAPVGFTRERCRAPLDVAEAMALHRDLGESYQELARRLPRIVPLDRINLVLRDPARDVTLATAGFEHNPALIGLLAPILIAGPGRFALRRFLPLPRSAPTGRPIIALE